ncbi:YceD family protein [Caldimonas sp. KR1-144]|uniref:YceD family protein n=1 Tax=Caldimonas sp. KR1-144 TaxID=3400911 RepID=UPI003BFEC448
MAAPREHNPRRLDVAAFATAGTELQGQAPLADLPRLAESAVAAESAPLVSWRAQGERKTRVGAPAEIWLHLHAAVEMPLECQRCLAPVTAPVEVDRRLRFVDGGEAAAAALDADSEDDVLPLSRSLDLIELVEDELLLALPIVPRHEVCPKPLPVPAAAPAQPDADNEPAKPNPFAALAKLKKAGD